jgi:peptidoglycan/xylan/chitin deacetylase (PgdA/CDA1 family)
MLTKLWYTGLGAIGLTALTRWLRRGAVIVCYHNVIGRRNGSLVGDPGLHAAQDRFAAQVGWLNDQYEIVSLKELQSRLEAGRPVTRTAALTFDDGYAGVFQYAWPVLRALEIPATVFVVADAPEHVPLFWWDHPLTSHPLPGDRNRWLVEMRGDLRQITPAGDTPPLPASHRPASWDVIRAAAKEGLHIGSHSTSHRTLTRLTDEELEQELRRSREIIGERIGVVPDWFAYPYGIWDARVRDAVRKAGYSGAVTLDAGLNQATSDPWSLRRVSVPASISPAAFEAWIAGLSRGRIQLA